MAELFIVLLGLAMSAILALIKVIFAVAAITTAVMWIPTFVAVLIVLGIWLPDLAD